MKTWKNKKSITSFSKFHMIILRAEDSDLFSFLQNFLS